MGAARLVRDFEHLFHNLKIDKRRGRSPRILVSRHLSGAKTFLDWQYEHKEWFDRQSELDDSTNHAQQAESGYTRGWLSYVTAVWQIVMGRMTEGAKIQEEGLREARENIELPDYLADLEGPG